MFNTKKQRLPGSNVHSIQVKPSLLSTGTRQTKTGRCLVPGTGPLIPKNTRDEYSGHYDGQFLPAALQNYLVPTTAMVQPFSSSSHQAFFLWHCHTPLYSSSTTHISIASLRYSIFLHPTQLSYTTLPTPCPTTDL